MLISPPKKENDVLSYPYFNRRLLIVVRDISENDFKISNILQND